MHQYETTSTVKQSDACIPKQFAHRLYAMNVAGLMMGFIMILGVVIGVAGMQENMVSGLLFMGIMAIAAVSVVLITSVTAKKAAAQMHPSGDDEWMCTTWFEQDGVHRMDDEEDESVFLVKKLVCAYRAGNVLLLCTKGQSIIPVNLAQLSETDRKSVFERIKTECPRMKIVKTK